MKNGAVNYNPEPNGGRSDPTMSKNRCLPHKPQSQAELNRRAESVERLAIGHTTIVPLSLTLSPRPAQIGLPKGEHLLLPTPANQPKLPWKSMKLRSTIYPKYEISQQHQDSNHPRIMTRGRVEGEMMAPTLPFWASTMELHASPAHLPYIPPTHRSVQNGHELPTKIGCSTPDSWINT